MTFNGLWPNGLFTNGTAMTGGDNGLPAIESIVLSDGRTLAVR